MGDFSYYLNLLENLVWGYLGAPLIILLGVFLCLKSRFIHLRRFPAIIKIFFSLFKAKEQSCEGIHPLKAFFASFGGCIGVGNIVATCTAVQLGGPGALFWIWVTALIGMIIKYAEVFLGLRYRKGDGNGGYVGGPIYFLQQVFSGRTAAAIAAILLCIYGVEVYQFRVVIAAVAANTPINEQLFGVIFLGLILAAASGGIKRVTNISSAIIPVFVLLYMSMGLWVLCNNIASLPSILYEVVSSAFFPSAMGGGFVGSSLLKTISEGSRRSCYSSDIGVGYSSMIHSESSTTQYERQASLSLIDIFLDAFMVCTTSTMLILITGVWNEPIATELLVQHALGKYFSNMEYFMPLFLCLVGYSTINAYFCVGMKCAQWLSPRWGKLYYYTFAIGAFALFSQLHTSSAQSAVSIAACLLLLLNGYAIFKLRNEISYSFDGEKNGEVSAVEVLTLPQDEADSLLPASRSATA